MQKYFAYGSNCDPTVLEKKKITVQSSRRAVLRGYRLLFNKKSLRESLPANIGFANINQDEKGEVEGILYELSDEDLARLDASERHPKHYDRVKVYVLTEDGPEACWTYQAQPDMVADGLVPSRNYLNHILAARGFLSQQYLEALDQSQTFVNECVCCHRSNEVLFVRFKERLHTLCQPCREARLEWGAAHGRELTLAETESIMTELVMNGPGFDSIRDLLVEAIRRKLIEHE